VIGPSQLGMPGGASSPQLQVWSCWQCLQACDRAMTTGRTYTDTWTHKHYMQLPTPPPPPLPPRQLLQGVPFFLLTDPVMDSGLQICTMIAYGEI
jgi:hypothetical protein